jgi:hypothetical protein
MFCHGRCIVAALGVKGPYISTMYTRFCDQGTTSSTGVKQHVWHFNQTSFSLTACLNLRGNRNRISFDYSSASCDRTVITVCDVSTLTPILLLGTSSFSNTCPDNPWHSPPPRDAWLPASSLPQRLSFIHTGSRDLWHRNSFPEGCRCRSF